MGQGEGRILSVGTILLPGGNRRLKLTGSLELVEKRIEGPLRVFINGRHTREEGKKKGNHGIESDLDTNRGQGLSVHLHLSAGVQKNNRPSASIAMVCVLVSLLTGSCIPTNSYDIRGRRISVLAFSFKYNWLDLIDNALQQSHFCGRYQREKKSFFYRYQT